MAITNTFLHLEPGYDLGLEDQNLDNPKGQIAQSNAILLSILVDQNYYNMIKYRFVNGGNSWFFKCNRQKTHLVY